MHSTKPFQESKRISRLTGIDIVLAASLTLIYTVAALVNLGSKNAPETFWLPERSGETIYADFGKAYRLNTAQYYTTLGSGRFRVAVSLDGKLWAAVRHIGNETMYEPVGWRVFPIFRNARYLKITAEEPGVMLNEIVVFADGENTPLIPLSVTGTGTQRTTGDVSKLVFDEQDSFVAFPSYYNSMYFDERYHARTAYEHLHRIEPTETTHPPLGKLIISAGIALFGMNPFGWRIMGALFGIAMVPLMYLFGKQLFGRTLFGFTAALLMAVDCLHFVQSRIATLDVYAVLFIVLTYYWLYRYCRISVYSVSFAKAMKPLFLSGLFFGLGVACKWNVLYAGPGLAVLYIAVMVRRLIEYRRATAILSKKKPTVSAQQGAYYRQVCRTFPRYTAKTLLLSFVFFVAVPASVYIVSYIPFMLVPGPGHGIENVIFYQKHMYAYHASLSATHPFSSAWWEWPLIRKPVWYYTGQRFLPAETVSSIVALGNPAVWWPACAAVLVAAVLFVRRPSWPVVFVLTGFCSQYLPWIVSPRSLTFIYHFSPAVPFLILSFIAMQAFVVEKYPRLKYAFYAWMVLAAVLFVLFYPVLSGMAVPKAYAEALRLFDSWIFYS